MAGPDYKAMLLAVCRKFDDVRDSGDESHEWMPGEIEAWWNVQPERAAHAKARERAEIEAEASRRANWIRNLLNQLAGDPAAVLQKEIAEEEEKLDRLNARLAEIDRG